MGLFDRLRGGFKGVQDALLTPAADPRQEFASAYERQLILLQQVREALAALRAYKARLAASTDEVRGKVPQLAQRARHALITGREADARLALQRQAMAEGELTVLSDQIAEMAREEERLAAIEQRIAVQVEAFATHQTLAAARSSAAQTRLRLKEELLGVSDQLVELSAALEDSERQARQVQARAAAVDELVESGLTGAGSRVARQVEQRLAALEVDGRLAALKRDLGIGSPTRYAT
ncbi:MAG TPA: hypothetical protein VFX49_07285 [Chloroflexota bacterium]|nr:hypothetical protein [Chloroflexota bacterium]